MEPSVSNTPTVPSTAAGVREWHKVDLQTFREQIFPASQPAILRGLVRNWPAVVQGLQSADAIARYLLSLQQGTPASLITADPSIKGRFFYRDDMRGTNFLRAQAPLSACLQALLKHLDTQQPPGIYMEAASLPAILPTFTQDHCLELLPPFIMPRIWIGNAVKVQTHYDYSSNIACVVAGRRRFTLFPPDQFANLYAGPLDNTPAGVPVSMVRLDAPDFEKYPRFRFALEQARVAELDPGDALFIPYAWWHHVESLTPFNVLVNYWWNNSKPLLNPSDSLLHAVFAIRDLPPEQRAAWRNFFDYYVFQTSGDSLAHLAPEQRGVMGARDEPTLRMVRTHLLRSLGGL